MTTLSLQLKGIVKQIIVDKSKSSVALSSLQSLIISQNNLKEINDDWNNLINEIGAVFSSKASQELKNGVARCIGFVGFLIDEQFEEFITFIAEKCRNSKREEERAFLLQSLHDSLINHVNANKCVREPAVKNLMEFTKAHLDINDSPMELIPLLDICQLMAKYYSFGFRPYLHDICDYVIGWLLDQTQPKYVENKCREIIRCFGPIFVSDIQEAVTFLHSLIDDCFYIVDQLENPPEDITNSDKLSATIPMLKVFAEIFESSVNPANVYAIQELINKIVETIDSKLNLAAKSSEQAVCQFYAEIGKLLLLMESVSGDQRLLAPLPRLLYKAISHRPVGAAGPIISLIRLLVQALNRAKQPLKTELIDLFMNKQESCLVDHLMLVDKEVSFAIAVAFSKLLDLGDLSNLQAVYSKIAEKILTRFKHLKESLSAILSNKCKMKELFLIALLTSLRSLSTTKNSIIVMRGLDPGLFSLLFEMVPLKEGWLITYFPALHNSLLCLARSFSETHDYFLPNSEMFRQVQSSSAFTLDGPTKGYFAQIIVLLTNLLEQSQNLSVDSQTTLLKWLDGVARALGHMPKTMLLNNTLIIDLQKTLLMLFIENIFEKNNKLAKLLLSLLNRLHCFDVLFADQFDGKYAGKWMSKAVYNASKWTSEEFSAVWNHLPANFELGLSASGALSNLAEVEQEPLGNPTMAAFQFQMLTDFLLGKVAPSLMLNTSNKSMNLCADVFYSSLKEETGDIMAKRLDLVATSKKWRFIVAHYALYCVENRMKTPIGKALETFTKFENEIRELIVMITSRTPSEAYKRCVQCSGEEEGRSLQSRLPAHLEEDEEKGNNFEGVEIRYKLSKVEEFVRVRLLVQMLDSLDKLMVSAWHGRSLFNIADISSSSCQFFQINQASCQGWLTRVAAPVMQVCFSVGNFDQIVRLGGFLFADHQQKLEAEEKPLKIDSSLLSSICWMVRALVELAEPQAIRGIQKWSKKMFSNSLSFEWMPGAEFLAAGRVESALKVFSEVLISWEEQLEEHVVTTVKELKLKALDVLRNSHLTKPFGSIIFKSDNYEAWDSYKKFQMESVLALSSWDSLNNSCEVKNKCKLSFPWELDHRINELELDLLNVWMSSVNNKKYFNARSELSSISQEMGEITQTLLVNCDKGGVLQTKCMQKAGVLNFVLNSLRQSLAKEAVKIPIVRNGAVNMSNPSLPELDVHSLFYRNQNFPIQLSTGNMLSCWLARLNQPSNFSASKLLHTQLAKLAWRLDNNSLAEFHLQRTKPPVHNTQFFPNPMAPSFPQPTAFMNGSVITQFRGFPHSGMAMPARLSDADFESILLSAKMKWKNSTQDDGRIHCFEELADAVCIQVGQQQAYPNNAPQDQQKLNSTVSKMVLRLGKWTQSLPEIGGILYSKQASFPRIFFNQILHGSDFLQDNCLGISGCETLKGSFFLTACTMDSTVVQAHKALADWAIHHLYSNQNTQQQDIFCVTAQEEATLNKLGINTQDSQGAEILELFDQHTAAPELKSHLKCCKQLVDLPVLLAAVSSAEFGQLWLQMKRRQFKLFEIALTSFAHYLEGHSTGNATFHQPSAKITYTCLQILKLMCEHTEWFVKVLQDNWLDRIDANLWKALIPQLFARLNHANLVVRNTISRLLIKIGELSPHAICFPAIVNSQLNQNNKLESASEDKDEFLDVSSSTDICLENRNQEKKDCSLLAKSSSLVVAAVEKKHPDMVKQVKHFCTELQQIHMLPEEKWLFVLNNLDHDLSKRFKKLEGENAKVRGCMHLSEEDKLNVNKQKLKSIMQPISQLLTDLFQSTCTCQQTTVLEKRFQSNYKTQLSQALETFHTNQLNPNSAWAPLKKLMEVLNQKANKKSSLCLYIHEMSPYLASLGSTAIAIPGQENKLLRDTVKIHKMNKMAYVLSTKTRPKKISFKGSDGKDYTFLLKGQEDLHLDERVMQLLTNCNQLLSEKKWTKKAGGWPEYSCNSYSINPLGPRWGLIGWVEEATPLFQIYRKWRARQAEDDEMKINGEKNKSEVVATKKKAELVRNAKQKEHERPIDMFFNKLKTVLQKEDLPKEVLRDRHQWPVACLEKVLNELIQATPHDILSKELWMRSGDSRTWWRVTQRFARSSAVMSMVGAIVGLGDRHLDNVLINLTTGELIHVDYNVCFEKGRQLRIPETVPFRLTRNIVNALGPTQIEGTYRESCEHVLDVLRTGKQVLVSMLNAFVYDPLVEWNQDQPFCSTSFNLGVVLAVYGSDKRTELSKQYLFPMFIAKLAELKKPWKDVGLRLEEALKACVLSLKELLKHRQSVNSKAQVYEHLDKTKAEAFSELKAAITEHHNIMLQFRPLLRALASTDTRFESFLQLYKSQFSRPFVESHKLLEKESEKVDLAGSIQLLSLVLANAYKIHNTLLELEETNSPSKTPLERDFSSQNKLYSTTTSQSKDIHANIIACRIRRKLNGYEIVEQLDDTNEEVQHKDNFGLVETEEMSPTQQANFLIEKAMNMRNLSLMYEGWTAWV